MRKIALPILIILLAQLACATRPVSPPPPSTPAPHFAHLAAFRVVTVCAQTSPAAPSPIGAANGGGREGVSCTVTATYLHLRACPEISCPILAWLPQGATLTIAPPPSVRMGEAGRGSWSQLTAPLPGYVKTEYISCP